jgi:hypothetical protein
MPAPELINPNAEIPSKETIFEILPESEYRLDQH